MAEPWVYAVALFVALVLRAWLLDRRDARARERARFVIDLRPVFPPRDR